MARFDVVVVGAGPSGSSTAMHLLARAPQTRIAIVERHRIPREKPCGGAISRWGIDVLRAIDAEPSRLGVRTIAIRAIRVRHGARVGEVRCGREPFGEVVRRDRFDAALAREAVRRGAVLFEGRRVVAMRREVDGWRIELDGGDSIEARVVVGADGTGSAVRRLGGFEEGSPRARLVVLETEAVDADDVHRPDGGVIEFDLTSVEHGVDGYVWHFATPLEDDAGRWMVSRGIYDWRGRRPGDAVALRRTLKEMLDARGVNTVSTSVNTMYTSVYKPYTERVFDEKIGAISRHDGVLLVGEAAGLVDPVTGEGIAQALASGEVGARAADDALRRGFVDVEAYAEGMASLRCAGHLRQARALAPHVYGRRGSIWCAALAACPDALEAGADWYVGAPLSLARKIRVGAAMAGRAVRLATSGAVRASRE